MSLSVSVLHGCTISYSTLTNGVKVKLGSVVIQAHSKAIKGDIT